jgi:glucose/arabinose dehydrogenase
MAFDTKGRLWVATWPNYPHWKPKDKINDGLMILEDSDGDGKADKRTMFAQDLENPTGFEFYNGGVIVAQVPNIVFLKDTDGDDKYDVKQILVSGMDSADTHHSSNSFTFDPGGALYWQEGTFHQTQVETPWGPVERCSNAGVFRYEPLSKKFETYVSYGFANPHGHVFDRWGTDIVIDGTGAVPYYGPAFSGKVYYPNKHKGAPTVYKQRTRPCSGAEILSSKAFPDEMQGNLLVPNVITVQGILQYKLKEEGSTLVGTETTPIITSDDPNFRPADVEVGPDGAIWFTDWHNPIIGHMQHNLRDPSRDKVHGRVYRITYDGKTTEKAKVAGASVAELLDLLKSPENRVRYRAKIELSARKADEVIAALKKWVDGLDKSDKDYEHQMAEALWVHQWFDVVNADLLKRNLRAPDYHTRAAATRVLCYWRDRVENPLALLKAQANDESPRVRLEALRACSFFQTPEASEVALEAINLPQDKVLEYVTEETMKTLEKFSK